MFRKFLLGALLFAGLALIVLIVPTQAASSYNDSQQAQQPDHHGPLVYEAQLSGTNEVPTVTTSASGRAVLVLEENATTLHYRVMVSDIMTITSAGIYMGAAGEEGELVFSLFDQEEGGTFDPDHPISGTVELNAEQLAHLLVGHLYVNIHTEANPEGEIRGQVQSFVPPSRYAAFLSGAQEVPPVETNARGRGMFVLHHSLTKLNYHVTVTDIVSVTLAHIHVGWPGEVGPPVIPLFDAAEDGTFDENNPIAGTTDISAENLLDLLTGRLYVNVHTVAHPSGEIRGQIGESGELPKHRFHLFLARLSGSEEVPPVETNARGRSIMLLDEELNRLYYYVSVTDIISVTAAHIHEAPPGVPGPVIFPLYDPNTTDFGPGEPIIGVLTLNDHQENTLIAGNYYVNVHTVQNPQGEIRGQLRRWNQGFRFRVRLGEDQGGSQAPDQTGSADVMLQLSDDLSRLDFSISFTGITNVSGVHLHFGPQDNPTSTLDLISSPTDIQEGTPLTGSVNLNGEDVLNLLTGEVFVEIHTGDQPGDALNGTATAELTTFLVYVPVQRPSP